MFTMTQSIHVFCEYVVLIRFEPALIDSPTEAIAGLHQQMNMHRENFKDRDEKKQKLVNINIGHALLTISWLNILLLISVLERIHLNNSIVYSTGAACINYLTITI